MQLREKKDLMSTPLHNANVLDKPPPIGNPTEEGFGAPWILHHLSFLRTNILLDLQACRRCSPHPRTTFVGSDEWKHSGIPLAATLRSQHFSQFQRSFSAKPWCVPDLPMRSRDSMSAVGTINGS